MYCTDKSLQLYDYVDLDFASNKNTRHLTERNIFFMTGRPILWKSKYQKTITLSIIETEYMIFTHTTIQALWLTKYFDEISLPIVLLIII